MKVVANDTPTYQEKVKRGLLIGNHSVQARKLRHVTPGKTKVPQDIVTIFGWGGGGAKGHEGLGDTHKTSSHRIATKSVITNEAPESRFAMHTSTKKVMNPVMVKKHV